MAIEWTLTNASGKAVWIETVERRAEGLGGSNFTHGRRQEQRFNVALQNLFEESQKEMLMSRFLRSLSSP